MDATIAPGTVNYYFASKALIEPLVHPAGVPAKISDWFDKLHED